MNSHKMKLLPIYFDSLRKGVKYIEIRCNDEKRQKICVGDQIAFCNIETCEEIQTEVIALEVYSSFEELIRQHPIESFGFTNTSINEVLKSIRTIYSEEQEHRYGVLALILKKI